jgi:hypothetical protein
MLLDEDVVHRILDAWHADEEHPLRGRVPRELPPVPVIRDFVDEAFLATLRDEEGRPISFGATLLSGAQLADALGRSPGSYLALGEPFDYSAEAIAKVAPALDPKLASLVVVQEGNEESLKCRGVWLHRPFLDHFTEIPVVIAGSPSNRLDYLNLVSRGRGSLLVARGNSLIGALRAREFVPATPTPFSSRSLGGHLIRLLQAEDDTGYWHIASAAVELLLSEAALRGHGSTIAILPRTPGATAAPYNSRYVLMEPPPLETTLRQCVVPRTHPPDVDADRLMAGELMRLGYREFAYETLARIAQMTTVDGALVMDSAFSVLAFGAKLTAEAVNVRVVTGPDGFGQAAGEPFEIARYGTRHSSAMYFAAAVPDSVVFVVSQDGPVRAFRRIDETTVEVWPDCTSSMFI